jgi:general stress protein 26
MVVCVCGLILNMRSRDYLFVALLLLAGACLGQANRDSVLLAAREIMMASKMCGFVTMDGKNPQVRTMDPFPPESDFTIWLATNPESRKVKQLKKNSNVVLYYSDPAENGYVTVYGKALLVNDPMEKSKHWKEEWRPYYPNRDTQYLLIKVVPHYLEVINYKRGLKGDPKTWQPVKVMFEE